MNENNQNQEKKEMEVAGQNTAHVAGKAAATYLGGAAGNRIYDKVSNTKIGQKVEQGVGKTIAKVPGVNKLNKGLNDVGAVDAVGKAADIAGLNKGALKGSKGKSLNGKKSSNSNSSSLKKSSTTSNHSTPSALQKKGQNQGLQNRFLNRKQTTSTKTSEENKQETSTDYEDNYDETIEEKKGGNSKLKLFLKILPMLLPVILILLVLILLVVLVGSIISSVSSFFSLDAHKTDSPDYVYNENNEKLLKAEQDYNDALLGSKDGSVKGIIETYREKYNVTLDWYLLNAVVTYRYTAENSDNIYTEDGLDEIDENEINDKLEELEKTDEEGNVEVSKPTIDYSTAKGKLEVVAALMITKNPDGTYSFDGSKDGDFYNRLIDSEFLKTYYKNLLKDQEQETRKKLVDEIFEYAEIAKEVLSKQNGMSILSDNIQDYLQTCDLPYKYTTINGITVWNNPSATGDYPQSLSMLDYLKGVTYGEIGGSIKEENREGLKAFLISALTFIIRHQASGFDLKTGMMYAPAGNCKQLCCDPNVGCTYKYHDYEFDGRFYGTSYSGPNRFSSAKFNRQPMSESESNLLDELLNEVFGYVMVKKGVTSDSFSGSKSIASSAGSYLNSCSPGTCLSQEDAMKDAKNGMTYIEILNKYYSNVDNGNGFDLINIREGLYSTTDYSNQSFNGNVVFYKQTDYRNVTFCGRSGRSISSSGCGVTSAAIVASSLTGNRMYDPVYMMNLAYSTHDCGAGISGTNDSFFPKFTSRLNLGYRKVGKGNTNAVVEALKTGNSMVIAHMGPGHFTSGGHYIVLSGLNEKGEVYVYDPNAGRRNGYWSINLIASELKGSFHIITKG